MDEQLMKPAEIAELLQVSRSLVYKLLKRGEIPTVLFDSAIRVKREDLERYIFKQTSLGIKGKGRDASGASK